MEGLGWITSLGSSAAAVVVVIFFLKHLAAERTALAGERETHERHSNERAKLISTCVDRNTLVITENTVALAKTAEVLGRINERV